MKMSLWLVIWTLKLKLGSWLLKMARKIIFHCKCLSKFYEKHSYIWSNFHIFKGSKRNLIFLYLWELMCDISGIYFKLDFISCKEDNFELKQAEPKNGKRCLNIDTLTPWMHLIFMKRDCNELQWCLWQCTLFTQIVAKNQSSSMALTFSFFHVTTFLTFCILSFIIESWGK